MSHSSARDSEEPLRCPSAQPDMADAAVLGVRESDGLAYVDVRMPVTPTLVQIGDGIDPTRVLRYSAHCEESRCSHFDGQLCRLATRIVQLLPAVVDQLPACNIRNECRWFAQEGAAACQRCPQIMTLIETENPLLRYVALGETSLNGD